MEIDLRSPGTTLTLPQAAGALERRQQGGRGVVRPLRLQAVGAPAGARRQHSTASDPDAWDPREDEEQSSPRPAKRRRGAARRGGGHSESSEGESQSSADSRGSGASDSDSLGGESWIVVD